jgi:UrcA family protein
MTKHLFLLVTCALTAAAGAVPADAQAPLQVVAQRVDDDRLTERVSHRDLNLAAASGQKSLHLRVRSAVRRVCSPLDGTNLRAQQQQCRSFAWAGAKPQMARAVEQAQQLAATGSTSLAEVAIAVRAPAGL